MTTEWKKQSLDRWKNLEVGKLADDYAFAIYSATVDFPQEERYGISAQLRRSALSVPTNIVEGYSRKGDKELSRFTDIALGSLAESRYLLHFARRLDLLQEAAYIQLMDSADVLGAKLWRFSTAVRTRAGSK